MFYTSLPAIDFSSDHYFEKFIHSARYFLEFKTKENYFAFKREYYDERGNCPENSLPVALIALYQRKLKEEDNRCQ